MKNGKEIGIRGNLMNYDYYSKQIYDLLNGDIKTLLNNIYSAVTQLLNVSQSIETLCSTISVYASHIAVSCLMLVLLYVGFKFLRIRSKTL